MFNSIRNIPVYFQKVMIGRADVDINAGTITMGGAGSRNLYEVLCQGSVQHLTIEAVVYKCPHDFQPRWEEDTHPTCAICGAPENEESIGA